MTNKRFPGTVMTLSACLLALSFSSNAFARGDAQRGKEKSVSCQACHGPTGNGENPAFPKLAGQYANYLAHALEAYTTGERRNAIMQGMAAPLSKQDREDLAAWYASQEGLTPLDGQR